MEAHKKLDNVKTMFSNLVCLSNRIKLLQQKHSSNLPIRQACDVGYKSSVVSEDLRMLEGCYGSHVGNFCNDLERLTNDKKIEASISASSTDCAGYNNAQQDLERSTNESNVGGKHILPPVIDIGLNSARYDNDLERLTNESNMCGEHLFSLASLPPAIDMGLNCAGYDNENAFDQLHNHATRQDFNLSQTHYVEHVLGVNVPSNFSFSEKRLENLLSEKHQYTTNFLYHLYEDNVIVTLNDDYHGVESSTDVPFGLGETLESSRFVGQEHSMTSPNLGNNHQLYSSSSFDIPYSCISDDTGYSNAYNTMDAIGSTSMDYEPFELNDDTIELDIVNVDDITEPDIESSTVQNLSNAFVTRENEDETEHSTSEDNDTTPWKIDIKPNQGCDDTNMLVPTSDSGAKEYCCIYCLLPFTKLARHLQRKHADEADVKTFCRLRIGSKERKKVIAIIRKKGQFEWNSNPKLNLGKLSTCRRPNKKFQKTAADFNSCPKCLGSLSGNTLSQHFKSCSNNTLQGERKVKELSRAVEGRYHPDACDDLRKKIFPKMRANATLRVIRFDWLIVEYGNGLCLNYFPIYQHKLIRSKLRAAGTLLVASKEISSEITDFSSLFHVKQCNVAIEAIRKVTKFDLSAKRFGSPGTATTLVTLVKAIGDLLLIEYMKRDDPDQETNVERFLKVFTKEAKLKINKLAAFTQAAARRSKNKEDNMPSTDDVSRFATYLDGERDKLSLEVTEGYSYVKWKQLSELTLASILVFNRRRVGEMMNIILSEFNDREMIASYRDKIVPGALPEHTSQIIKSRMTVRGKLGRDVPVLLKHGCDESIQLLLRHREDARISSDNDFLFALYSPSGEAITVDACTVIRTYANRCSADKPGTLRGTKLRKHMASICGTMGLTDNDVTNVANFMGHDDQIHRNVYRHNTLQSEVVQMTSILEAAQGKKTPKKTLNQTKTRRHAKNVKNKGQRPQKRKVVAHTQRQNSKAANTKQSSKKSSAEVFDEDSELSADEFSELSADEFSELSADEDDDLYSSEDEEAAIVNSKTDHQKKRTVPQKKQKEKKIINTPATSCDKKKEALKTNVGKTRPQKLIVKRRKIAKKAGQKKQTTVKTTAKKQPRK